MDCWAFKGKMLNCVFSSWAVVIITFSKRDFFQQLVHSAHLPSHSCKPLLWFLAPWLDGIYSQREDINISQPLECCSASLLKWFGGRSENTGFIFMCCCWKWKLEQAPWTGIRQYSQIYRYTPFNQTIPYLGIYPKHTPSTIWKSHVQGHSLWHYLWVKY